MTAVNLSGKTVLITGGTRGIGLETGLTFGGLGAHCILTYRWGEHDEPAIREAFSERGAPAPLILQADVANKEDTRDLMQTLKKEVAQVDIFISNVSVAMLIKTFEDYSLKGLKQSISYSSWPLVNYTLQLKETFGKYPKYVMGVSSTGPDHYSFGYDFVAASKTVMEILCRYLNYRLRGEEVVINAVRSRAIKTDTFEATFGAELAPFVKKFLPDNYWIKPTELAKTLVALCSGYCDALSGQILNVDKGTSFFDNFMDLYTRHQRGNLKL